MELYKGNLLVLIIKLYLKKRVLKEYTRKPLYWVGEEWCLNIFFLFSYIFNTKMTVLAPPKISIEIETNSETIYVDENI